MISPKMVKAVNGQINTELYSAYLYLSMAAYFHEKNLPGFANWLTVQFEEEQGHAKKFYKELIERGARVTLKAIDAPPVEWPSPLAAFEAVLEHEQKVAGLINNLVSLAKEEKDYASEIFLQWFVSEQVEEEAAATEIVARLKLIKDNPQGLFMIDRILGERKAD